MIKSAFLACAILAPLPLIAAQPLGLPLVGDESSSSPFGGGIGGTDSEPHGTNGGWIGQPVSRRSTTSKRQLEFAALDGNSAPVANELVHDNNMAASLGGTIAGLDASSDKTGPPPPAKRHLAPRGALISVSGNSVPVANDVMRNNNAAADVLGDITQLDSSAGKTTVVPPPAAPANEEAQAPGQEVDDGAETADTEEEALGPQLNKLVPIHKRQDLELVQINDNTIPVGNDAVHNNNGMADVLGDITAADASSGKTTVPPPAPAPQSDQAGVEDTPADTGTEDTEAAEPLALMNTVQDGSKKSVRKRQDLELAAIDGNSAPVANELVHNNNMAASVAGTIAGLDASSDKTGPPPPAKRALLARAAISMSGNSVPMANDAVHNNNVAGSVMGDITQIDASSGKTDILPAAPASEAAPEQEADAQDQSEADTDMDDRDLVETVPLPNRKRDTLDSISGLTKQNNKKEALSLPQNDPLHENDVGIEGLHILKRSHDGSGPLRLRK